MAIQPFDNSGIVRGDDGIARYRDRPMSLVSMLRASVDRFPEVEAIVELGGRRLSYRQLWDAAARVAGGLREDGVRPGDRVANLLPAGADWVVTFLGAQLAGAVIVPVNTRLTTRETDYVIDDSGAHVICESGEALPDGEPYVYADAGPTDLAAIFYTSGTTGLPKGAMTSHENFLSNNETVRRTLGIEPRPLRSLISVPLFHVTGCNSQLLVALEHGGTAVIMPTFEVGSFVEAINAERIHAMVSVPAVYWLAINQSQFASLDTSGVEFLTYGGAPIAPDLVGRIVDAFPNARVGNAFGLTETSSIATFLPHEYAGTRPDSVGFAAPVVDLQLGEGYGTDVGELLIRGPNVVTGYWNKPEATEEVFNDGWLHTGDLARIDDDGFVVIVDRVKDMINRGGENVYCVEVENVLSAHPDVLEVAVVGVEDEVMGEKVGAVVVPASEREVDASDLLDFARKRLADYKVPEFVSITEYPLPRNAGGKVLKPQLRQVTRWEPVKTEARES